MKTLTNLVRKRYEKWCENDVLFFFRFGAKTLKSGAKSRIVRPIVHLLLDQFDAGLLNCQSETILERC